MRWILVVAITLVGLVALIAIVGAMLPRDHVASVTARIAANPGDVWTTITTPAAFPEWRSDVKRVELLPSTATGPSWREHGRNGALTFAVEVWEPPTRFVGRIADTGLPFGGSWEYRVDPDGPTASRVTITERGSIYNPIFRFVSRFVTGYTATMAGYLKALAHRFGGETSPEEVAVTGGSNGI
jgi:polyketide cyclase/dehydrase/lipid transport protein